MDAKQLTLPGVLCEGDTIGPVGGEAIDPEGVPSCPFCSMAIDAMPFLVITMKYGEVLSWAHETPKGKGVIHLAKRT